MHFLSSILSFVLDKDCSMIKDVKHHRAVEVAGDILIYDIEFYGDVFILAGNVQKVYC